MEGRILNLTNDKWQLELSRSISSSTANVAPLMQREGFVPPLLLHQMRIIRRPIFNRRLGGLCTAAETSRSELRNANRTFLSGLSDSLWMKLTWNRHWRSPPSLANLTSPQYGDVFLSSIAAIKKPLLTFLKMRLEICFTEISQRYISAVLVD